MTPQIIWRFHYVSKGQMTPDKSGRWAVYGHLIVDIEKGLAENKQWLKNVYGKVHHVKICKIEQNFKRPIDDIGRFSCTVPSFPKADSGFSDVEHLYGSTLEEVQAKAEEVFTLLWRMMGNCKMVEEDLEK